MPKATGDDVLHNHATQVLDRNDFAPRFGVAYRFDEKTTVRTGYGIYYAQDTGNPVFDMGRNFGVRQTARSQDLFPLDNLDDPWANQRSSGLRRLHRPLASSACIRSPMTRIAELRTSTNTCSISSVS